MVRRVEHLGPIARAALPKTATTKPTTETTGETTDETVSGGEPLQQEQQEQLFTLWRHHGFVSNSTLSTVAADETHRDHAIIEQVIAEPKNSALAHLPEVILSPAGSEGADLRVCVVDGVVDAKMEGSESARSGEFRGSPLGRVGRWAGAGDAGCSCSTEGLGESLAQLVVVRLELAQACGRDFQPAQQGCVAGALSLRGR